MSEVLEMAVVEELLSLSDDGDPELLLDLIRLFLDDGPVKVESVMQGLAAKDFDKMERAAHSLKGSSGNLGARLLQYTCEKMQLASRGHKLDEMKCLAPELQANFAHARAALEAVRQRYSPRG